MKTTTFARTAITMITAACLLSGCAATAHPSAPTNLGVQRVDSLLEAVVDQPGPLTLQTFTVADWQVNRSGLVNLDNPIAKAADLKDGDEPIQLYVHVIRHPTRGVFLVDTGVEHAFIADPSHALIAGFTASLAHLDQLKIHEDTRAIVASAGGPIQGVFLTHLHPDHVLGMRDVPASIPVYVGAGDAEDRTFMNLFQRGLYDAALAGKGALREIGFSSSSSGAFKGVRDLFGDGSLWAIWVPGHTPGTIAYLARTSSGPVLIVGDACHTAWGWQHGVEPGTFSDDVAAGADSLARLKRFVARHPTTRVWLGHQRTPGQSEPG